MQRLIDHRISPFLVALLTGLVVIVAARLIGASTPIIASVIAGVLASATISFLAIYQWRKKEQIIQADPTGVDRVGDELYYLGLIFTLVSLIFGLIYVSLAGQNETREAIGQLVGSFAIALISTLVGIVLRILFQSVNIAKNRNVVKFPPGEAPQTDIGSKSNIHPSSSLLEATIKFEHELQASIELVKQFRAQFYEEQTHIGLIVNGMARELDANLKEFPRISKETLDVTSTQLSDVSTKMLENLGKESTKMCADVIASLQHTCESTLSSIEERSKETMEQIANGSQDHLNSLSDIYSRNEALVKGTVDKIEQDTASYLRTVELAVSDTSTLIKAAMSDIRLYTSNLATLSHSVNDNLRLGVESLQVLDRTVKNVSETLSRVQEPAISTERATKTMAADISTAKSGLDAVVRDLEQLQPTITAAKADSEAIVHDLETVKLQTKEMRSQVAKSKRPGLRKLITKLWPGLRQKSE